MKHVLLAAVAIAGLMEEAEASASVGGSQVEVLGAQEAVPTPPTPPVAQDIADTSGDTPGQPAGAHLDRSAVATAAADEPEQPPEPEVVDGIDEYVDACRAGKPKVALIGKYDDRVPVQIKNTAHLRQLEADHGAGNVEVQS